MIWSAFAHNSEQNLYLIGSPSTGQPRTTPRQASGCGGDCAFEILQLLIQVGDNWELWENVVARSMRIRESSKKKLVLKCNDTYSHPQIDGKVNHHQISRHLLFHLFGDDYTRKSPKQQVTKDLRKFWAHLCWIGGIIVSRHPGEEGAPRWDLPCCNLLYTIWVWINTY